MLAEYLEHAGGGWNLRDGSLFEQDIKLNRLGLRSAGDYSTVQNVLCTARLISASPNSKMSCVWRGAWCQKTHVR